MKDMAVVKAIMNIMKAYGISGVRLFEYGYNVTPLADMVDNVSILKKRGKKPVLMVCDIKGNTTPLEVLTEEEREMIINRILTIIGESLF